MIKYKFVIRIMPIDIGRLVNAKSTNTMVWLKLVQISFEKVKLLLLRISTEDFSLFKC